MPSAELKKAVIPYRPAKARCNERKGGGSIKQNRSSRTTYLLATQHIPPPISSMYSHYLHNRDILAGYSTIPAPNEGSGFEDLLANIAAEHFPLYDEKVPTEETLPISALSPITMSSGTSSVTPSPSTHSRDIESDVDPDSDVEELDLQDPDPSGDNARLPSPCVDFPFMTCHIG